jgi:hypothetical protein
MKTERIPASQARADDYDPQKDGMGSYYAAIEAKRLRGDAGMRTPRAKAQVWTEQDDEFLRANHGIFEIKELAEKMGRSRSSLRGRITRLGIAKRELWTDAEEQALIALYEKGSGGGVLHLNEFARSIGRDPGNVSRKAGWMGLETNQKRKVVEERKVRVNKFATAEERATAQSNAAKERIKANGHPRGMLGKQHTDNTRKHLSMTSKAYRESLSEEERLAITDKALATARSNGSLVVAQIPRGSWKAGWRDIGGKRNFYRSRWEANYARYLEWLKSLGEITEWQHEPETFWFEAIRRGVRSYKPDFRVWEKGGSCLHEVKGWMDDRSRVCLKRMAKYYPQEKIVLVDGRQYRAIRLKVMGLIEGWEDSKRDTHA